MFKLAELFVSVVADTSSLDTALRRSHANLSTANIALGTFAGNVAASFARMAVGAAGGLFEGTIHSASHLAETMNKVQIVLGDGAKQVISNAEYMADQYGFVKKEVIDASSSFALLGKEMKMSDDAASAFGTKLTKLAADATSLSDIPLDRMFEKMRMALAGQARPLRELGIFMTAQAIKEEAARMGLKPRADTGQLSEGDKIKARVSFIENSTFMKKAAGDLERTLQSTENQTRKFWGTLSNLGTTVGAELNPAWNKLLQDFNSGLDQLKTYFENNKAMIRGWGDSVVEGFNTAKMVWRNLPDVLEIALLGADQKMEDARAKIEQWATTVAVAIEKAFLQAGQATADYFKKYGQNPTTSVVSSVAGGIQGAVDQGKALADSFTNWWDKGISRDAKRADFLLRPLRDLNNLIERQEGVTEGHEQSVEDRVNRLQGIFSGPGKFLGGMSDYLKTFQDVAAEEVKAKPTDFTSGLIDKANKHLADTMAQNTDISSKGIAAAQARIAKREAAHLDALANQWIEDTEYDKMFPSKEEKAKKAIRDAEWVPATERDLMDEARRNKLSRKEVWGPATEEQLMAEAARNKAKRDAAKDEDEDAAVLGGKTKHHKMIEDTASFAMNLRAANLGGGDVQDKQLTELQLIRAADQKNADMMEKMLVRQGMAVFG